MNYANTAGNLQQFGRNGDTMLVHMSPQEVGGLQTLARRHGTSLTVNPQTGLPEAFNLKSLLPTIAGAGLMMIPGMQPLSAAMITGGLGALMTGDLGQGLMMGLGAAGGAGLAGSVANLASPAAAAAGTAGQAAAGVVPGATIPASALTAGSTMAPAAAAPTLASTAGELGMANAFNPLTGAPLTATTAQAAPMGMFNQFNTAGLPSGSLLSPDKIAGPGIQLRPDNFSPVDSNLFGFEGAGSGQGVTTESIELAGAAQTPRADAALQPYGTTLAETRSPFDKMKSGFGNLMDDTSQIPGFLMDNKMELAMAAAPMLMPEEQKFESPVSDAMIRPYELDVINTSGLGSDYRPGSTAERQMLEYKYRAGTPYRAAKGGIISYQEGGEVAVDSDVVDSNVEAGPDLLGMSVDRIAANPTFRAIADVQRAAGLNTGLQNVNFAPSAVVNRPVPQPREPLGYKPIDYGVKMPEAPKTALSGIASGIASLDPKTANWYASRGLTPPTIIGYDSRGQAIYSSRPQHLNNNTILGGLGGYGYYAGGGEVEQSRMLRGPGDGVSDSIPAIIGERQPARLADGEYVVDARTVAELGNGSSEAGAKKLKAMVDRVHGDIKKAKRGKDSNADRHLPA